MKPTLAGSKARVPTPNEIGRSRAGLSRASRFGTEPLCRYGAVAQMPLSGRALYSPLAGLFRAPDVHGDGRQVVPRRPERRADDRADDRVGEDFPAARLTPDPGTGPREDLEESPLEIAGQAPPSEVIVRGERVGVGRYHPSHDFP